MMRLCEAKTRSNGGLPCKRHPMANGRCYLHGGKSTGAKTAGGKMRQKMASWKHGFYSKEAKQERRVFRELLEGNRDMLSSIDYVDAIDSENYPCIGKVGRKKAM